MLEASQSSKSILAYVADYAELATSEEEIAACKALLDSIVTPVRAAPNNPLEAVEPVTAFHVGVGRSDEVRPLEPGVAPEAGSSSAGELIYRKSRKTQALYAGDISDRLRTFGELNQ